MSPQSRFLTDYLVRVGLTEAGPPDLETLRRLHASHVEAIPFENLDVLLGRGIRLDADSLREKLIVQRRGGYCFEQNTLFLAVLQELGFSATPMEARVRTGATALRPRTHMVLSVLIDNELWLADVGFGGEGLLEPVRMDGEVFTTESGIAYRVIADGGARVLQMRRAAEWEDQYAFLLERVHAVDFEMANWFTSTHPQSPFVRTLTAQRTTRHVRYVLRYPLFTEVRASGTETREISRDELLSLLRSVFLIDLPDGTTFPVIDGRAEAATV